MKIKLPTSGMNEAINNTDLQVEKDKEILLQTTVALNLTT